MPYEEPYYTVTVKFAVEDIEQANTLKEEMIRLYSKLVDIWCGRKEEPMKAKPKTKKPSKIKKGK